MLRIIWKAGCLETCTSGLGLGPRCDSPAYTTISLERWVQLPDPPRPGTQTGIAARSRASCLWVRLPPRSLNDPLVQWQRHLGDNQESAGSIPAGITRWSVGVSAAHLLGKEEDRVRFPDGPPAIRAAGPRGRRLVCTQAIGVRVPGGPLMHDCVGNWIRWPRL